MNYVEDRKLYKPVSLGIEQAVTGGVGKVVEAGMQNIHPEADEIPGDHGGVRLAPGVPVRNGIVDLVQPDHKPQNQNYCQEKVLNFRFHNDTIILTSWQGQRTVTRRFC